MANENPISLGSSGPFTRFKIPVEHLQDDISITIKSTLLDEGWKFDSDHVVTIQGNLDPLYNDDPPPEKLVIGTGEQIRGKKFRISSRIRRIRDGADNNKPSRVEYKLIFFAGNKKIDEFVVTSDETNPENFISSIKFA
jgi:hypothetical protein